MAYQRNQQSLRKVQVYHTKSSKKFSESTIMISKKRGFSQFVESIQIFSIKNFDKIWVEKFLIFLKISISYCCSESLHIPSSMAFFLGKSRKHDLQNEKNKPLIRRSYVSVFLFGFFLSFETYIARVFLKVDFQFEKMFSKNPLFFLGFQLLRRILFISIFLEFLSLLSRSFSAKYLLSRANLFRISLLFKVVSFYQHIDSFGLVQRQRGVDARSFFRG